MRRNLVLFSPLTWAQTILTYLSSRIMICPNREESGQNASCGGSRDWPEHERMSYSPQQIANYFLDKAESEGRALTPMKLIKLVYIAYGWVLALKDQKLFDEPIQAWTHGPVIPSIYHEFKHFRSEPISERAAVFDMDSFDFSEPRVPASDDEINFILDTVWSSYKRFSGSALRQKTHEPDTPWSRAYVKGQMDTELKDDDIREHFRDRIGRYLDAAESQGSTRAGSVSV